MRTKNSIAYKKRKKERNEDKDYGPDVPFGKEIQSWFDPGLTDNLEESHTN